MSLYGLEPLCRQSLLTVRRGTATQYALLTSVAVGGGKLLSAGGGWAADQINGPGFFVATALLAVPGLAMLVWIIRMTPGSDTSASTSPR